MRKIVKVIVHKNNSRINKFFLIAWASLVFPAPEPPAMPTIKGSAKAENQAKKQRKMHVYIYLNY